MLVDKNNVLEYADYAVMMRNYGYYTGYYGRTTPDQFENDVINKLGSSFQKAQAFSIDFYINENFDHDMISIFYDRIELHCKMETSSFCNTYFDNNLPDGTFEYEVLLSGIKEKIYESK